MGVISLLVLVLASSSVLVTGLIVPEPNIQQPLPLPKGYRSWDTPPAGDQPDNLIFFRLATLLQHWPNTRYPSGHSVVPGTVPIGTTLYHGRPEVDPPTLPDWLAFDPEHSLLFIAGKNARLSTFVTTRPLRVLYFDGSSAAKMSSGSMDTQDLLLWGELKGDPMMSERDRINGLCEWGKEFGIDGYVRMEMSFEIMYCNFSQGIELVSSLHILPTEDGNMPPGRGRRPPYGPEHPPVPRDPIVSPPPSNLPPVPTGYPRHPPIFPPTEPRPPNWKGALPNAEARVFEVFQAGSWHNRAPGEVRVKLDAARMVSLYDPALNSSAISRRGKEKVLHRAGYISKEDVSTWKGWIEDVLRKDAPTTSGVDWPALATVIMDRYGERLEYLQFLLDRDRISQNATAVIQNVRAHLMLMLVTDITADYVPTSMISESALRSSQTLRGTQDHAWAEPIASHCSSFLVSRLPKETMTREERTLYAAITGTQAEICRVLSLLWAEAYDLSATEAKETTIGWRKRVDELMEWLDWPMWNRCKPECSVDTMCFIPTWPMGIGRPHGDDISKVDWTPRCVPRGVFTV